MCEIKKPVITAYGGRDEAISRRESIRDLPCETRWLHSDTYDKIATRGIRNGNGRKEPREIERIERNGDFALEFVFITNLSTSD